jgi:hypothetical protein
VCSSSGRVARGDGHIAAGSVKPAKHGFSVARDEREVTAAAVEEAVPRRHVYFAGDGAA